MAARECSRRSYWWLVIAGQAAFSWSLLDKYGGLKLFKLLALLLPLNTSWTRIYSSQRAQRARRKELVGWNNSIGCSVCDLCGNLTLTTNFYCQKLRNWRSSVHFPFLRLIQSKRFCLKVGKTAVIELSDWMVMPIRLP